MLLAADIGNTNISLGLFPFVKGKPIPSLSQSWRLATNPRATADEIGVLLLGLLQQARFSPAQIKAAAVASVVPSLDAPFREMARRHFNLTPLFVGPGVKTGVRVLYDNPVEVGADRIVNAAAAYDRVKGACIVVDFGTATTFDCVSRRGEYLGGVIAPGPRMAAEALAKGTAKLPLVGEFRAVSSAIGKNTQDSIGAGLYYGYIGLVKQLLAQISKEMGGKPAVLATGGLAGLLTPAVPALRNNVPDLTLQGLRLIWERNQNR